MTIYTAIITLILVMDPLGNLTVFLTILKRYSPKQQRLIILRESAIAFLIIVLFLFFGRYILHGLNISPPALRIAGGMILFIIAIGMIFPQRQAYTADANEEPFIVPMAIPLIAGPSALATVVLFATQDPRHMGTWFFAVIFASLIYTVIVLSAGSLIQILGKRGLTAMERLMGMILTTISVQMFLQGIQQFYNISH